VPRTLVPQLAPFVDGLPLPQRLIAEEHHGSLVVRMRMGDHRFHRDLPPSKIWGYEGMVPGPTIEAERGQPVTVEWRNELRGPFPLVVTRTPTHADGQGVPVQCVPGLSGGTAERNTDALA
jgi:spore coat protein A